MIKVTGVRFRQAGKVYYFDPKNLKLERGSHVIVETAREMCIRDRCDASLSGI